MKAGQVSVNNACANKGIDKPSTVNIEELERELKRLNELNLKSAKNVDEAFRKATDAFEANYTFEFNTNDLHCHHEDGIVTRMTGKTVDGLPIEVSIDRADQKPEDQA